MKLRALLNDIVHNPNLEPNQIIDQILISNTSGDLGDCSWEETLRNTAKSLIPYVDSPNFINFCKSWIEAIDRLQAKSIPSTNSEDLSFLNGLPGYEN